MIIAYLKDYSQAFPICVHNDAQKGGVEKKQGRPGFTHHVNAIKWMQYSIIKHERTHDSSISVLERHKTSV